MLTWISDKSLANERLTHVFCGRIRASCRIIIKLYFTNRASFATHSIVLHEKRILLSNERICRHTKKNLPAWFVGLGAQKLYLTDGEASRLIRFGDVDNPKSSYKSNRRNANIVQTSCHWYCCHVPCGWIYILTWCAMGVPKIISARKNKLRGTQSGHMFSD